MDILISMDDNGVDYYSGVPNKMIIDMINVTLTYAILYYLICFRVYVNILNCLH